jgi:hypothetical protein
MIPLPIVKYALAFALFALLAGCQEPPVTLDVRGACLIQDGRLRAGFSAVDITPANIEGYEDLNGNGEYDDGEPTIDTNGNGVWEPLWLAGFGTGRAALGVHDPIWARTMVLQHNQQVVALTVVDVVGLLPRSSNDIRAAVMEAIGECYDLKDEDLIIASTHTHEAPDSMGLWGEYPLSPGVQPAFMASLVTGSAESIVAAMKKLTPATVKFGNGQAPPDIIADSRKPIVIDNDILTAMFIDDDGNTLGHLTQVAMHPEVLWSKNPLITSDYPHYVRERMEEVLGGINVFAVGMLGGLLLPRFTGTFAIAETTGTRLADEAIASLVDAESHENCSLALESERFVAPIDNVLFKIVIKNNVLWVSDAELIYDYEGCETKGCAHVPVVGVSLCGGEAQLVTIPGELYPELGIGGYEKHPGYKGAFPDAPLEKPIRTEMMSGNYRFTIGLANAAFGYIIPKSQWDDSKDSPYGEGNSLGPNTAPLLAETMEKILDRLPKK